MNTLIIYATYSSGTLTVSELIQSELLNKGHKVDLINAAEVDPLTLNNYDLVMLGSPSWMIDNKDGQPHHLYFELMKKMEGMTFENKNFAIFGLGDNAYARLCGAVDVLEEFVEKIQGKLITDSLRVDSFYFDREKNEGKVREWVVKLP